MLTCNQEGGVGRESRLSMPGFGPVGGAVGERLRVVRSGCYPWRAAMKSAAQAPSTVAVYAVVRLR